MPNKAIAAGWGSTFSGGSVVTVLREVELTITTDASCVSHYGSSYDPITMICLGDVGDNKDTCQGDSGGPNVAETSPNVWSVIGVTSWGYGMVFSFKLLYFSIFLHKYYYNKVVVILESMLE